MRMKQRARIRPSSQARAASEGRPDLGLPEEGAGKAHVEINGGNGGWQQI